MATARGPLGAALLALAASLPLHGPASGQTDDAWVLLGAMRERLMAGGATSADFVQTYLPSGFTEGEREPGRIAFDLPRCVRWDYFEPYPKSFLVCGGTLHSWNPEDRTGVRRAIDSENEPGLDLLLLDLAALARRYQATLLRAEASPEVQVRLLPLDPNLELRQATLTLEEASARLVALETRDSEGDLSYFAIGDYHRLTAPDLFRPPAGIAWEEEP